MGKQRNGQNQPSPSDLSDAQPHDADGGAHSRAHGSSQPGRAQTEERKNGRTEERKTGIRESRVNGQKRRAGSGVIPHILHAADRLTQRTVKFIRWLKNHLDLERDWDDAIAKPSRIYQHL
jgi:hypothetical protein